MTVIFDMDGVLVNTEPLYAEVTQRVLAQNGGDDDSSSLYRFVGISSSAMWSELKEEYSLDVSIEELMRQEADYQNAAIEEISQLNPIPGIPDLLSLLSTNGVRLALASSSSQSLIKSILTRVGLLKYFDAIVSSEDVENGKPAPDIFLAAAQSIQCQPASCVVIEDSPHGLAGAKAAGMAAIGFQNPGSGSQCLASADLVISEFGPRERLSIIDMVRSTQQS